MTWLMSYYMVDLHIYSLNSSLILFRVWLICLPAMTSACIFKDPLRSHTQAFLEFRNSILTFVYISLTSTALLNSYLPLMQSGGAGTSNEIPLQESGRLSSAILITLPIFNYWNQSLQPHLFNFFLLFALQPT